MFRWSILLHPRRVLMVATLALVASALVACTASGNDDDELPTTVLEITVGAEGVNPPREQVRVPDRYQLVVTNASDEDCSFYLGDLVRDLEVAPGETSQVDVQFSPSAPGGDEQVEMGCLGDDARQGMLVILNSTGGDLGG